MNPKGMRKTHEQALANLDALPKAKTWDEAMARTGCRMASERTIEVCDIFDRLTDEERARLAAIPIYRSDMREVADIKEKYSVSWNELRMLRGMAHS